MPIVLYGEKVFKKLIQLGNKSLNVHILNFLPAFNFYI